MPTGSAVKPEPGVSARLRGEKRKELAQRDISTLREQERERGGGGQRKEDKKTNPSSESVLVDGEIMLRLRYTRIIVINVHLRGETEPAAWPARFRDISQPWRAGRGRS